MGGGRDNPEAPHAGASGRRLSKTRKRLNTILTQIPSAREQLLAAIDDLGPSFDVAGIKVAATSSDPRERNKVAVIERETDLLIGWLDELAKRGLAEARKTRPVGSRAGGWEELAQLKVISGESAKRLQDAKDIRNEFAHAYPPASWRALVEAVEILLAELDSYKVKVDGWLRDAGVLDPPTGAR